MISILCMWPAVTSAVVVLLLTTSCTSANPLAYPQREETLSESSFRSFRDEETPDNKINVMSGYAQVRRQGRNLNGEVFEFKRPLKVRDPFSFASRGRGLGLSSVAATNRIQRPEPVFNLEDMLRKEAAKLKAKVQEASLKAAKAAEEAEQKLESLVEEVIEVTDSAKDKVDKIVGDAIETGIRETEEIIEKRIEETETKEEENASAKDVNEEGGEQNPVSVDIEPSLINVDLGSVQEV